jgi:mRNA interferase MazF
VSLSEGDIIEIDADGAVGHEQSGRRPALIISVNELQAALGLAVICAVTTHGGKATQPRNAMEVPIPEQLPVVGVVLSHQLRTIDLVARNARKRCSVPRATLLAVRARLKVLFGI